MYFRRVSPIDIALVKKNKKRIELQHAGIVDNSNLLIAVQLKEEYQKGMDRKNQLYNIV